MMAPLLRSHENRFRPAVVAPTYNNAETLVDILGRLEILGLPVFAVNDGSTDQTSKLLSQWSQRGQNCHALTHIRNRGKAAALQTGFAAADACGFTHAVTIDTDGQLRPEDIPGLLEAAADHPTSLIVGHRDAAAADYPFCSRIGRSFSNGMIFLESGQRVADSQCGLRVYPLSLVKTTPCRAGHFGFETEIITRAGWAGFDVVSRPVDCTYGPPPQRVSHFKPWLDTPRAIQMHARLLILSICYRLTGRAISRPPGISSTMGAMGPALQPQMRADGQH